MVGITQGCQNHEDLGGSTSSELQDLFTRDKNYLGSAGPPNLAMKEKDPGLSAIWGCLLPSGFTVHSWQGQGCSSSSCHSTGGDISLPHLGCCNMQMFVRAGRSRAGPHSSCVNGRRAVCVPAAKTPLGSANPRAVSHCCGTHCCRGGPALPVPPSGSRQLLG